MKYFLSLLVALVAGVAARATSVVPPSFAELVGGAEAIYRGTVTAVQPRLVAMPDGSSMIETFVTLAVERTLKGTAQTSVTLELTGGTLNGETVEVSGMPHFTVGARELVFVTGNGTQFCPLVRMMHGRYRVAKDTAGRDYIARDNGRPLNDTSEVSLPMEESSPVAASASDTSHALTPAAFEAAIATENQRQGHGPVLQN